jgi:thiol-disulfide isomerase/thioredoxin
VVLNNKAEYEEFIGLPKVEKEVAVAKSKKAKEAKTGKNFAETNVSFVIFTDRFCETCKYTAPIWASFSNRFSTPKIKFAELDVTNLAALKKHLEIA